MRLQDTVPFRNSTLDGFQRDNLKRQVVNICFLAVMSKCLSADKRDFHINLLKESSIFDILFTMYVTLAEMGKREARTFTMSLYRITYVLLENVSRTSCD